MQTRWMLWMEEGATLRLLPAVPRAWLQHGQRIELNRVASYFGPFSLTVDSQLTFITNLADRGLQQSGSVWR